jgi:hypothetical protein
MKDWQLILTLLFAVGWISWAIDKTGDKIIQRIDRLEAKIGEIESKQNES